LIRGRSVPYVSPLGTHEADHHLVALEVAPLLDDWRDAVGLSGHERPQDFMTTQHPLVHGHNLAVLLGEREHPINVAGVKRRIVLAHYVKRWRRHFPTVLRTHTG
jgi:hypothetical protein